MVVTQLLCLVIRYFLPTGSATLGGGRVQRVIGVILLLTVVFHISLFMTGVAMRQQSIDWFVLVPVLTHGHYRSMISLGGIAFVCMLLLSLSGYIN